MLFGNKAESNIAVIDENGQTVSYGELEEQSRKYAETIEPNCLVMICCYADIETVSFYYCMLNNRVKVMLLDKNIDADFMEELVTQYRPQYVWKKSETGDNALIKTEYEKYPINGELAVLITTSGSTGSPKFVRLSYRNIIHNADGMANAMSIGSEDVGITVLPYSFCFGLSALHAHWSVGAKICVMDKNIFQHEFRDICNRFGVTDMFTVPYHYSMLEKMELTDVFNPQMRKVMVGGGKLESGQLKKYKEMYGALGIELLVGYGQTEGTTILSCLPCGMIGEKAESIGSALPLMKVYLDDVNEDGIGELIFEGDSVSLGYASNYEDLIKGDENHGVLHTGDLAYIDNDGFIYLKGRMKRFVKILGIRTSLDELENRIKGAFGRNDIVCSGVDNAITVYHVDDINEIELKKYCRDKMKISPQMLTVKQIVNIPIGSNGKVLYSKLR